MAFSISYHTIFELRVWHHHFLDPYEGTPFTLPPSVAEPAQARLLFRYDLRRFLSLTLTQESKEAIQQRGMIFKVTNRGCLLVKRGTGSISDEQLKVSIVAKIKDPAFAGYTNLDGAGPDAGRLLFLSNSGLPVPAPGSEVLLSDGGWESSDVQDWRPRVLRLQRNSAGADPVVRVLDPRVSTTVPVLETQLTAAADQEELQIDCRSLREGLYLLESDNIEDGNYYLGLENQGGVLAVIEIYLQGLQEVRYDIRLAKP